MRAPFGNSEFNPAVSPVAMGGEWGLESADNTSSGKEKKKWKNLARYYENQNNYGKVFHYLEYPKTR